MRALTLAALTGGMHSLAMPANAVIMTFSVPAVVTASSLYFEAPGDAFLITGFADLTQLQGAAVDSIPAAGDFSFTAGLNFFVSLDPPYYAGLSPFPTFYFTDGKLTGIGLFDQFDDGGHVEIGGSGASGFFDVLFGYNPFDPSQSFIGWSGTVDFSDSTFAGVQVGVVPEPAAWGLMVLGFGLAGAALRGRSGRSRSRPA
jgi:hypothetical protein